MRTIESELQQKKLVVHDPPERKQKPKEKLSRTEWEEIMGLRRQTYTRKNGAIRAK